MKKIAVIGAGPAGLVAAKLSLQAGYPVTVFEQEPGLGGTWLYSPDPAAHSAIYEGMVTNMPKQLMEYEDVPYPEGLPTFLTGDQVLEYLRSYAEGMHIELGTRVVSLEENREEGTRWKVTVENSNKTTTINFFDVVFVCTGHCRDASNYVDFSDFQGTPIHSHNYRRAGDYENQIVAVVGTGYSGVDIALQLSEVARKVILVGNKQWRDLPDNVEFVAGHVTGATADALLLSSGDQLTGMDTVIDCTGYRYRFPFLDDSTVQVTHKGKVVEPVWRLVAHMFHPTSLFFIDISRLKTSLPPPFTTSRWSSTTT